MTALIIILCIVAFFALLFSIPAHVVIEANSDVRVYARVLFIKAKKENQNGKKIEKNGEKSREISQKTGKKIIRRKTQKIDARHHWAGQAYSEACGGGAS